MALPPTRLSRFVALGSAAKWASTKAAPQPFSRQLGIIAFVILICLFPNERTANRPTRSTLDGHSTSINSVAESAARLICGLPRNIVPTSSIHVFSFAFRGDAQFSIGNEKTAFHGHKTAAESWLLSRSQRPRRSGLACDTRRTKRWRQGPRGRRRESVSREPALSQPARSIVVP